jgi:CheY-like chemotaxis protein
LVDDDAEHAETVARALRSRYPALHVEVARHGVEAIEKTLDAECPSLLVADFKVPAKDGQLLGKILKQSYGKRIEVRLMVDPHTKGPTAQHVDVLLEKPVDLTVLYSAVEEWLAGRRTADKENGLLHFHVRPKLSHGKHGILVPRDALVEDRIDPDVEYEVYLKRCTKGKKEGDQRG